MADPFELQTTRLLLRAYTPEDAPALYRVVSRPEIYATTAFIPQTYPRARADWWIRSVTAASRRGVSYELAVTDRRSGRYLGNAGITQLCGAPLTGSITYFIDPDAQRRGYATEACRALLPFAFRTLGLARLDGCCMAENTASRRVMEKLGFAFVRTERGALLKNGVPTDLSYFLLYPPERSMPAYEKISR